jgi:hypothetical protein
VDLFFSDDPGAADIEFGFVLQRGPRGADAAAAFIDEWVTQVLRDDARDAARVATFTAALARDLPEAVSAETSRELITRPALTAARLLRAARASGEALAVDRDAAQALADDLAGQLAKRDAELADVLRSKTHRAGVAVTAPVRLARRIIK